MKTRSGFIANSSSSSFVVPIYQDLSARKDSYFHKILSGGKIKKLIKFGFITIKEVDPTALLLGRDPTPISSRLPTKLKDPFNIPCLSKRVEINQDEIISFLLKEGIPFRASCHYGHETVIFDGKRIVFIPNQGLEAEMYGIDLSTIEENNGIQVKTRARWLRENRWLEE